MTEIRPWDRQPGEPRKAYHAFIHFRDWLAHERTLDKAWRQHQEQCVGKAFDPQKIPRANKRWKDWRRQWNWDARADAHDAQLTETARVQRLADIAQMNERHASIAAAVQGKVINKLNLITEKDLSPGQLIIWLEKATAIERRARGEATDIVKHEGAAVRDLSALTEEELTELERLLDKTEGRGRVAPTA